MGFRLAVWIGELPPVVADTRAARPPVRPRRRNGRAARRYSRECKHSRQKRAQRVGGRRSLMKSFYAGAKDASNSNHHIKMLAAYALLGDPRVEGLYFIDMDAYAPPEAMGVVPPLYAAAHGDGLVDVLFENSRDPRKFWHVHGDTFYLRDSPLARLFLREWITWRCGFKDQYSLWHAVLVRALFFFHPHTCPSRSRSRAARAASATPTRSS